MIELLAFIAFHICWMIFWNKMVKYYWTQMPAAKQVDPRLVRRTWWLLMTPIVAQVMIASAAIEMTVHWTIRKLMGVK